MSDGMNMQSMIDQLRIMKAELLRLSALADQWNTECDEMREDNKRLAAELATAQEWNERYAIELRELREQKPVAYLKFWAAQIYAGHGNIETDEGFEVCKQGEIGMDGAPAFPVYARPVHSSPSECTHDCNQGRDCTCQKGGQ